MDVNPSNGPDQSGQPFSDINGPLTANPASKPVITNAPQADPMISANPVAPAVPLAADTPLSPAFNVDAPAETASPEFAASVQTQSAVVGDVSKRPKGKKLLVALLVLLLLGGGGYGGWMYYQKQTDKKEPTTQTNSTTSSDDSQKETTAMTLFTSKIAGFSVDNVEDWKVEDTDTSSSYVDSGNKDAKYAKVTFTINDKQFLVFDNNPGGRGGDCEPAAKDKPFTVGNICSSHKTLSVAKLPDSNFAEGSLSQFVTGVYLVKEQFMAVDDARPITYFGLTNSTKLSAVAGDTREAKPTAGEEDMGAYVGFTILSVKNGYIDTKIVDKDGKPTQLSDADLAKVETMLKTFKLK